MDSVAEGFDITLRGGFVRDSGLVARRVAPRGRARRVTRVPAGHGAPASPADLVEHQLLGVRFASGQVAAWRFHKRPPARRDGLGAERAYLGLDPEALVDWRWTVTAS